jgi:hypothetical protein
MRRAATVVDWMFIYCQQRRFFIPEREICFNMHLSLNVKLIIMKTREAKRAVNIAFQREFVGNAISVITRDDVFIDLRLILT